MNRAPRPGSAQLERRRAPYLPWILVGVLAILLFFSVQAHLSGGAVNDHRDFATKQFMSAAAGQVEIERLRIAAIPEVKSPESVIQERALLANLANRPAFTLNPTATNTDITPPHEAKPCPDVCTYGVVVPVAPRKNKEGNPVEYWKDVIDNIPPEITHVYVLTRMQENQPSHPRISRVIVLDETHSDLDPAYLGRPILKNHGDSDARIKWRSSLTLDFAFALRYLGTHCKYVLWIEDDAILPPGWFDRIKAVQHKHENWTFDAICRSGAVGLLLNSRIAQSLSQYLIHRFDDSPFDWSYNGWERYYRQSHPQFPAPRTMNIIGHRGTISSLAEAEARSIIMPST